jgi:glycosyltransferase involved in cell wall biosynthesis
VVYAHEEGAFMAALMKPLFGIPFIYDMHSSLPLQIQEWKFSRNWVIIKLFSWIERFTLSRAAAAIAISQGVAEVARRVHPTIDLFIIMNRFTAAAQVNPEDVRCLRIELGVPFDYKLVMYTGSFVALQGLEMLIKAIPTVIKQVPKTMFVLVGGRDVEIERLQKLGEAAGVNHHLKLLPTRPQDEMPIFMAACDALVSPRVKGINPPGKLYSYLSSRRPVVATDCYIHNQILDHTSAILTSPDPDGLAEGIIKAVVDTAYARKIVRGAQQFLEVKFNHQKNLNLYRKLFQFVRPDTV